MNSSAPSDRPFSSPAAALKPGRRFTPHYGHDELGFLDPARSNSLVDAGGLLEHPAVLIKAQPWMGKTTFAGGIHAWLSSDPEQRARFRRFSRADLFRGVDRRTAALTIVVEALESLASGTACVLDYRRAG
jgi:hypothetical protein